ncbi:MAG: AsmA-like C-terminal domain-containing protein [Deltaproteobacteria bacterium]|nr:AsmA-like C-terminal domain-containing protein [Deltaproteobacteria bacterium]
MKKLLAIIFIVSLFVIGFLYLKSNFLQVFTYLFRKVTSINLEPSNVNLRFRPWELLVEIDGAKLTGPIDGYIGKSKLLIDLEKGIWLKNISLSDFEISVKPNGKAKTSFPPIENLEAFQGSFKIGKYEFCVEDLRLENLVRGRAFGLSMRIRMEPYFSEAKINAKGHFGEKIEIRDGTYEVKNLKLFRIDQAVDGSADLRGGVVYKGSKLETEGFFVLADGSISVSFLKVPYRLIDAQGSYRLKVEPYASDLTVSLSNSDGVGIKLEMDLKKRYLKRLKISTNFIEIQKLKDVVAVESLTGYSPWNYIWGGKVKVDDLTYLSGQPISAKLALDGTSVSFGRFLFTNVTGDLTIDGKNLAFSGISGQYKSSFLDKVNGRFELSGKKSLIMEGSFFANLKDLSSFIHNENIKVAKGRSKGTLHFFWDELTGIKYDLIGQIEGGNLIFNGVPVNVEGKFRFTDHGFECLPIYLAHNGTVLRLTGLIKGKNEFDLHVEGAISAPTITSFRTLPFSIGGISKINVNVSMSNGRLRIKGGFDFTKLSLSVSKIFEKKEGFPANLSLELLKRGKLVEVKHLLFTLGGLRIEGLGRGDPHAMDCDFSLEAKDLEKIARLFNVPEISDAGSLKGKISMTDFRFSLDKLPFIKGFLEVKDGFLKLPYFDPPIRNIDLRMDFEGEKMHVRVLRARIGNSSLKEADLKLEGVREPVISGVLRFDKLDISDFKRGDGKSRIPLIEEDTLIWRTKLFLDLSFGQIVYRDLGFADSSLFLAKNGAHFYIRGYCPDLFAGEFITENSFKLQKPKPVFEGKFNLKGFSLSRMTSHLKHHYQVEGKADIWAKFKTEGDDLDEMRKNLKGEVLAISKKGVIKKWNLIAKVLELLNVYQIVRLKIDLTRQGLAYNRMGGSFSIKDGKLSTQNFAIDSPSLIMSSRLEIDMGNGQMKGNISVSPLVAFEKTLDKIPIIRNLLRGKEKGFLSVDYSVRGKISDPEVSIDLVRTVPGKIYDILKNIFTLPFEALELQKKKD